MNDEAGGTNDCDNGYDSLPMHHWLLSLVKWLDKFKADEVVRAVVIEKLGGVYRVICYDERIPIGKSRVFGARGVPVSFALCYLLCGESGNGFGVIAYDVHRAVPFPDSCDSDNSESCFLLAPGAGGHELPGAWRFLFPAARGEIFFS